jgi:RNA polymerase sigma-54 factor
MLQSLEMLAMPLMELETHLKQELVNNPMLELQEQRDDEEDHSQNTEQQKEAQKMEEELSDQADDNEELKRTLEETKELSEVLDAFNEMSEDMSYRAGSSSEDRMNFDQMLHQQDNMFRDFFEQLDFYDLPENEYDFAYDLIDSTNEHGFLPRDFDIAAAAAEYEIEAQRASELHDLILHLEPCGITARTIEECLLAQLEKHERFTPVYSIIKQDFDDLIHKRYKRIASKYGVTINTVLAWRERIAHLDPKPGLRVRNNPSAYIVPDVIIKRIDKEYEIIINDFSFPKIRMSRRYRNILTTMKGDREAVDYVRNKINSAKFLIKSIYLRGRTLERVVKAIIRNQSDFFYKEGGVLKPLTYSVIADELQVNESTISRVVRNKYADTPFGILRLKDFFTSRAGKDDNFNSVSRHNVETLITRMIDNEDPSEPLSDQEIADRLKEDGIHVSRRVVAKYRKAKGILNSHLRRID